MKLKDFVDSYTGDFNVIRNYDTDYLFKKCNNEITKNSERNCKKALKNTRK